MNPSSPSAPSDSPTDLKAQTEAVTSSSLEVSEGGPAGEANRMLTEHDGLSLFALGLISGSGYEFSTFDVILLT